MFGVALIGNTGAVGKQCGVEFAAVIQLEKHRSSAASATSQD
jgi:hypothetical protein